MKKGIKRRIIPVFLLSCFFSSLLFAAEWGDVNDDAVIDIVDALLVAQFYVGLDPQGFLQEAADVSADGDIDIVDALLIAQFYVGLINEFPASSTDTPSPTPQGPGPIWSGGPYTLDGVDDYGVVQAGITNNLYDFTIAAWIYLNTIDTWSRIFDFGIDTTYNMFLTPASSSGTIRFAITISGSGAEEQINGSTTLPAGSWQHVAVVMNGNTGVLYINGAEAGRNNSMTLVPANLGNTTNNFIGRSQYSDPYLNGSVDGFLIYDRALSSSEILSLVNNPPGDIPTPIPTQTPAPTSTPGPEPPIQGVQPVYMKNYSINNTLWNGRISGLISNWIPYLYNQCNNTNLEEGGINNFIQAGRKNKGQSYSGHVGYWFSPVWVLGTFESMCYAHMVGGNFTSQINNWLPILLDAQEPDGYMSTWHQLGNYPRWSSAYRDAHEGYVAQYWIEAGIAHYLATGSTGFLDAAKRLADCWYNNAPGQGQWWDGHQGIKLALCRLARITGETKYAELARTLLEARSGGGEYDQSHQLPKNQSEAVGHAVRAVYMYTGMADVAALLNDSTYRNAADRLWDNLINYKFYVTGGLGSGESSEGFGANYSLPQNAYNETCAGIGNMFFNASMMLLYQDAKYIDMLETSLYNNVLGSLDLNCNNFYYTNPLDQDNARYSWHSCPCCVHNIARTWLQLPRWMYAKSAGILYINLFIGSTVDVGVIGGTNVSVTQSTDYPWDGNVIITVNPSSPVSFTIKIRSPDRSVSAIYSSNPGSNGITSLSVNGTAQGISSSNGYVTITRTWNPGDRIELNLPLNIERISAVSQVSACSGRVALQRGPVVYCFEDRDQGLDNTLSPGVALSAEWDNSLLNGIMTIRGTWSNGQSLLAIPRYARNNRGGRSIVWVREER